MADNDNRLAGTINLFVDGQQHLLAGNFTWSPSRFDRKTMNGSDGVHGFSEEPVAGFIAGDLRDAGNLSVADLDNMRNVTVMGELANGKVVIGRNMWKVNVTEVNSGEATVPVRWEGPDVRDYVQ